MPYTKQEAANVKCTFQMGKLRHWPILYKGEHLKSIGDSHIWYRGEFPWRASLLGPQLWTWHLALTPTSLLLPCRYQRVSLAVWKVRCKSDGSQDWSAWWCRAGRWASTQTALPDYRIWGSLGTGVRHRNTHLILECWVVLLWVVQ